MNEPILRLTSRLLTQAQIQYSSVVYLEARNSCWNLGTDIEESVHKLCITPAEGSLLKSLWRTWIKNANIFLTASEHSTSSKRKPLGQINPALPFIGRLSQGRKNYKWIKILQNLRSALLSKFWVMVTIARASLHHCSRTLRKDNLKN